MRTIKPEFWEDETVSCLSRDARLLFIATWNLADDEGILRWTASYIKANVFMYDDDIGPDEVKALMTEVVKTELIFPYVGGKAHQQLAYVVNFHRHQRVNRPQPSKLPPPSIQNTAVVEMYGRRDGMRCHLCKGEVVLVHTTHPRKRELLSLDHVVPRIKGGTDYPSNIRASHVSCNKARRDLPVDSFTESPLTRARPRSVNGTLTGSLPEGFREGGVVGEGERASPEPPRYCARHLDAPSSDPCGPCGDARREHERWTAERRAAQRDMPDCQLHRGQLAHNCAGCRADQLAADA